VGDAALPTRLRPASARRAGKRLNQEIRCLNFADARLALLDLAIVYENLELPRRSSSD
jgi:hypothetical protein